MDSGRNMTREPSLTNSMRLFDTQRRIVSMERPRILAAAGTSRRGSKLLATSSQGQGRGREAGYDICALTFVNTGSRHRTSLIAVILSELFL
jgi:hypothetical protein